VGTTVKYILYRPGKNGVGPFASFEGACSHMQNRRLIGYAVIPIVDPTPKGDQKVVASGNRVHKAIGERQENFVWNHAFTVAANARTFLNVVLTEEPDAVGYQIQLIKAIRELANEQKIQVGLREARVLVKHHPAVQKYDEEMRRKDEESK
jgi:ribosomal protein L7/L12